MKVLNFLGLLLFIFSTSYADTLVGCRSGNDIYTTASGASYLNGGTSIPIYLESPAYKMLSTGETGCGIPRGTATAYPTAPPPGGMYTTSSCTHAGNTGDISTLVYYNTNDIVDCPMDNYVFFLILISSVWVYWMRKHLFLSLNSVDSNKI